QAFSPPFPGNISLYSLLLKLNNTYESPNYRLIFEFPNFYHLSFSSFIVLLVKMSFYIFFLLYSFIFFLHLYFFLFYDQIIFFLFLFIIIFIFFYIEY